MYNKTSFGAIPTIYKGIQMRSRLEARWAAYFDQLKWSWNYEPDLCARWIPDFLLQFNDSEWFEDCKPVLCDVKPFVSKDQINEDFTIKILWSLTDIYGWEWPLTYDVWVLGCSPEHIWVCQPRFKTASWRPTRIKWLCPWETDDKWNQAGNERQWRAPK